MKGGFHNERMLWVSLRVATQLNKDAQFAALLGWAPAAAWLLAAVLLLALARQPRR